MAGKMIPLTLATVAVTLAFAVPAGAQGSMIPECLESKALCQPVGSKPAGESPKARMCGCGLSQRTTATEPGEPVTTSCSEGSPSRVKRAHFGPSH